MDKIVKLLNDEHAGFSGFTHWLFAILFFFIMWLLPWSFSQRFISSISSSKLFLFMIFCVIGGASLLPDLDSSPLQEGGSTAVYQLGVLGYLLSIVAISISQVVYSIFHTKYDSKPKSQHRMFWHTFLIPLLILYYIQYKIPVEGGALINYRSDSDYYPMYIMVFFASLSIYLGSNMLFYKLSKFIRFLRNSQIISLIFMIFSVIYMLRCDYIYLILIGESLALGYFFHVLADLMTKGSAPIFFPIPIPVGFKDILGIFKLKFKFQFWKKPYLFGGKFNITTGGVLNTVLNFVLVGADLFLFYVIFISNARGV